MVKLIVKVNISMEVPHLKNINSLLSLIGNSKYSKGSEKVFTPYKKCCEGHKVMNDSMRLKTLFTTASPKTPIRVTKSNRKPLIRTKDIIDKLSELVDTLQVQTDSLRIILKDANNIIKSIKKPMHQETLKKKEDKPCMKYLIKKFKKITQKSKEKKVPTLTKLSKLKERLIRVLINTSKRVNMLKNKNDILM